MVANLTTPLIGIVSTIAIGRLGDATLLGGVAIASVIFDCLFWLFAFLRMSTVAFTAQALGAGETLELRAIFVRGLVVAALIGRTPLRLFDLEGGRPFLLAPGDVVRFRPVDEEEYWAYLQVEEIRAFERRGR